MQKLTVKNSLFDINTNKVRETQTSDIELVLLSNHLLFIAL